MDFSISEEDRLLQQSVKDFVENSANSVWREIEKKRKKPLRCWIPPWTRGIGLRSRQTASREQANYWIRGRFRIAIQLT